MIMAMSREVELVKPVSPGESLESIYFGGGTPSLLETTDIIKLIDTVRAYFRISDNAEITLEANPDDITLEKLAGWKAAGINRFSIGIQSFVQHDLSWMNRAHNAEQATRSIELVKESGFQNFSVDLIYGTPGLSDNDWKKNVRTIIDLGVPHISCYALTVEPGTALNKLIQTGKKNGVDQEKQAMHFLSLIRWLSEAGYEHYEISNFAKAGYRSRHNSSYWLGHTYIGIGPSAHSFDGINRRWNISNNANYISSLQKNIIPYEEEKLTGVQRLNEYIMTSLRTSEGIDIGYVEKTFGPGQSARLQAACKKFISNYKLQTKDYKLFLTNEGKLFADGIAAELFFEEPGID